jgi:hypothetical protein
MFGSIFFSPKLDQLGQLTRLNFFFHLSLTKGQLTRLKLQKKMTEAQSKEILVDDLLNLKRFKHPLFHMRELDDLHVSIFFKK